ncbi:Longitudinals lacking protein, isoforms A/B/D/L [Anthophora plagiata]
MAPDRRRRHYNTGLVVNTASRGNFDCPKCQKTYKWYRGLHRHLKYECGFQILPAPHGQNMIFKSLSGTIGSALRKSLKMNACDKKKPFQCQKCGRGFTLKRNKDRHVNYECGHEPRFQCPYCGLRSKQTSPVYAHIRKKHPEEEVFIFDMKL